MRGTLAELVLESEGCAADLQLQSAEPAVHT